MKSRLLSLGLIVESDCKTWRRGVFYEPLSRGDY